jgi:D-amino-acid dehydrogenase
LLYLYETEEAFRAAEPGNALRLRHGIAMEEVDSNKIHSLIPSVRPAFARGYFARDAAHAADPKRLCMWLAERFVRNGGEIRREARLPE